MTAVLILLVGLGFMLLWILAWQRGSQLAVGIGIGLVLALVLMLVIRSLPEMGHVPIWAPPLPFALIAITLFGFGILAWFWGEE